MNDKFLYDIQQEPRVEFLERLYQQINAQPIKPRRRMRQFSLSLGLAGFFLVLALVFSQPVRALAQNLMLQLGKLFVTQEPTYAEQYERSLVNPDPLPLTTTSLPGVNWQAPPILTLAQAESQAGFPVAGILNPPIGWNLMARFVTLPDASTSFTRVTTTYEAGQSILVLTQSRFEPGAPDEKLPVGEAPAGPVTVHGLPGLWIENLRLSTYVDENNRVAPQFANLLVWEQEGFDFRLQSTPGLALVEMLEIADRIKP
ncbi:MAG: hypothetical protein MUE67_04410 [Anaerolineales bacterium]|jgi:hypothetical protein|nr:hypothetical protein [Anaerolineales bacterium]